MVMISNPNKNNKSVEGDLLYLSVAPWKCSQAGHGSILMKGKKDNLSAYGILFTMKKQISQL